MAGESLPLIFEVLHYFNSEEASKHPALLPFTLPSNKNTPRNTDSKKHQSTDHNLNPQAGAPTYFLRFITHQAIQNLA